MNCELFHEYLSAWLDRELPDPTMLAMREHAAACTSCHAEMEASQRFHELLSRELTPAPSELDRFCQRVVRQLSLQEFSPSKLTETPHPSVNATTILPRTFTWTSMALAALVGFLAAWGLAALHFRDAVTSEVVAAELHEFGKVVDLIPSPVIRYPGGDPASDLAADHQNVSKVEANLSIPVGCTVQSPKDYPCELTTHRGATVRMDQQTEVTIESEDVLQLKSGKLWYVATENASPVPLEIRTPLACLHVADAECHVELGEHGMVVDGLRGVAQVTLADAENATGQPVDVEAGDRLYVDASRQVSKGTIDPLLLPSWMDKVAILPGSNQEELRRRVASLWDQLEAEPHAETYAVELRKIGVGCSHELSAFICPRESSPSQTAPNEQPRRELASMILADIVDFDSAKMLVPLLLDDNHNVRYHAARGLARVAGHASTMSPVDWQSMTVDQCQAAAEAWRRWLADPHHEIAPQLRFLKKKV